MKRLHDDNAPEAACKPIRPFAWAEQSQMFQQRVEGSITAENALHAQRPDERRQNHRQQQRPRQIFLSRKFKAIRQPCQRQ